MNDLMTPTYQSIRYPSITDLNISRCYLCNKKLLGKTTPDHIIPDRLFIKGDPNRPQLMVHDNCNNKKSKEDRWFVKQLQLSTAYNPEVYSEFSKFLDKAKNEIPNAYIIGRKPRNLIMAKEIFESSIWGMELKYSGKRYIQLKISKKNTARFDEFIKNMCRGLFIRNITSSNPGNLEVIVRQYEDLKIRGKYDGYIDSIRYFIDKSKTSIFRQSWDNRIIYLGSRVTETPNKGWIFIEFYQQLGILGVFR